MDDRAEDDYQRQCFLRGERRTPRPAIINSFIAPAGGFCRSNRIVGKIIAMAIIETLPSARVKDIAEAKNPAAVRWLAAGISAVLRR